MAKNALSDVKNLFKGTVQIPFTKTRMPKTIVYPAILGGGALILYVLNQNGMLPKELSALFNWGAQQAKGGPNATSAIVSGPNMIQPNKEFPLSGTFVNEVGEPKPVAGTGYWYITDSQGNVRQNGVLGTNITEFNQTISLVGLQSENDYEITISDAPAGSAAEASFAVTI